MAEGETPTEVRQRLAGAGVAWGAPDEQAVDVALAARLIYRGMVLAPDVSLRAQGVTDGSVLRLVPSMGKNRLRSACDGRTWHSAHAVAAGPAAGGGSSAPRGLLMNVGARPWSAANPQLGPEERAQDPHTEKALSAARMHHHSLFAFSPKAAEA